MIFDESSWSITCQKNKDALPMYNIIIIEDRNIKILHYDLSNTCRDQRAGMLLACVPTSSPDFGAI